ncbi:MAG: exodeoxyribonuclease III [Acidobacteria bacterium]|nr:exodeoxyribonuclease III [Acidobacteriota bacterium]
MRIVTWNVNGLRACARKGFSQFLQSSGADVLTLQEVRAFPEQLDDGIRAPLGWHTAFAPAERPGYSGVAIYSRIPPDRIDDSLGETRFDVEGRFIVAHFGRMAIASVYFPKGSGRNRDNSRVPYKLDFYTAVFKRIERLRRRGPVFVAGDYNTAHEAIDLARPKANVRASGFLPAERAEMTRWLDAGWVDTFRALHLGKPGHYTWWRQFGGARESNVGWRIDYVLASRSGFRRVREAFIWPEILGSDHCPAGVDLVPVSVAQEHGAH